MTAKIVDQIVASSTHFLCKIKALLLEFDHHYKGIRVKKKKEFFVVIHEIIYLFLQIF
jgi:hypothetical protein